MIDRLLPVLPTSGQETLANVAQCIAAVGQALGGSEEVVMRAVAYETATAKKWVCFARALHVGCGKVPPSGRVIALGPIRLIEYRATASGIGGIDGLRSFVNSWPHKLGIGNSATMPNIQETTNITRSPSCTGWGSLPCWHMQFPDVEANSYGERPYYPVPSGPFFDPESDTFAQHVSDSAAGWIGIPGLGSSMEQTHQLDIVVCDPRGVFTSSALDGDTVLFGVSQTRPTPLRVHARVVDYRGGLHTGHAVVANGAARIKLPVPFRKIDAYLFGADSFCFDQLTESETNPTSRGAALFGLGESARDRDLAMVLDEGESEVAEVKAWMPLEPSESKASELLETVCAFANRRGGDLYIGVNDNLQLVDTARELYGFTSTNKGNLEAARREYALAVRRRIRESISPRVLADVQWIEHAGHWICRIRVQAGTPGSHYIEQSRESYIRRGASNKRSSPADWSATG